MRTLIISMIATACMAAAAHAQVPTKQQIDAQKQLVDQAMSEVGQRAGGFGAELKSNGAAMQAAGKLPGTTQASHAATSADFQALARPGSAASAPRPATNPNGDLMIFVSMSMPVNMLQNYMAQAKRFGAVLVMRGFVDDKMSATRQALAAINGEGGQVDINPEAFTTFKINKVPAIVLSTADKGSIMEDGCARPETYTTIFGDLSVQAALDKIGQLGQPSIAKLAKARLAQDRRAATARTN